jgi:hypothetical protein
VVDSVGEIILAAGTPIQEEHVEMMLNSDVSGDISVRKNSMKGIDAEAILEEAVKEP